MSTLRRAVTLPCIPPPPTACGHATQRRAVAAALSCCSVLAPFGVLAQAAPAPTPPPALRLDPAEPPTAAPVPATPPTPAPVPAPAPASEPSGAPAVAPAPPAADTLSPVVVTATRTERRQLDVPASVDVIDRETLRDTQLRVNLSESLARVPGLVLLNRQNYAQDLQLSIRGFGSRSTFGERGVRMYVDGIPATFPDGQGQVSHFPLNAAERVEVLRGPFSALYGNSSGGVIALTTRLVDEPPQFEVDAATGSNGTWRAGFSGLGGANGNAFNLDVARFDTDGERGHSAARRDSGQLRLGFNDTPLGRLRVSLNLVAMPDAQDPLGLTHAQLDADPTQAAPTALQFNTRKTTRQNTLGADLQSQLGAVTLTTTAWFGTRSVIQFQAIPVATQAAANSPGGVIQFDRRFGGADVRAALPTGPLLTTVGLDVERLNEDRRGYNNFLGTPAAPTNLGELGAQRRDETNTVQSVDPYVQAEMDLGTLWRLFAGVRHSQVKFKSADHYIVGTNGDDSGDISYSSTNPTAGVTLKITPQLATYVSYGRGFETPTLNELAYRPDGSAGLNTALGAARSNNVEWGLKGAPADGLRYAIAAFSTRTKNDIVVRTNAGGRSAYGNVASTRRDGLEASLEAKIASRWAVTASAARINARFGDAFLTCAAAPCTTPNLPVAAGNKLPGVPATTAFVELRWRTPANTAALEARAQSKLFVDDRNTDRAGGYAVFGFSAAHTFSVGATKPRLFARVDNLLDRRYVGSVIVNEANSRYFEPATGRTWLVGVDWQL